MSLKFISVWVLTLISYSGFSQEEKADTVIIPLAETSKIIFTIGKPSDLEILQHYNFQELFKDILNKLENREALKNDTTGISSNQNQLPEEWNPSASEKNEELNERAEEDESEEEDVHSKWENSRRGKIGQTWQSYNLDLGTNNYLAGGQFPDGSEPYAIRPWGSWYLGVNSVQRTRLGTNIFVEWGLGVSWYSFKFQEDNILIQKDEPGIRFVRDNRDVDYIKSKLTASFINASLIPMLDFGDHSRKQRIWDGNGSGFRFGVGPYVGYRISSKSKLVFEDNSHREKEKDRDNFYLNNLRYGFRLQLGVRSTDIFINYDMNDLFAKGKGPELKAISFGLIF